MDCRLAIKRRYPTYQALQHPQFVIGMVDHLRRHSGLKGLNRLAAAASPTRYRPAVTLNHMAAFCMQGLDLPEEVNDPAAGSCPCLEADLCPLYAVRPFGCRAMLSTRPCVQGGQAHMPPFILSLNNVIMQYLEAIDRPGGWGNLIDVLDKNAEYYENSIDLKINSMVSLIEPILIIILGMVVAFMLMSVYLPIFQSIRVVH